MANGYEMKQVLRPEKFPKTLLEPVWKFLPEAKKLHFLTEYSLFFNA